MRSVWEGGQKWGNLIDGLNWDPVQGESLAGFL